MPAAKFTNGSHIQDVRRVVSPQALFDLLCGNLGHPTSETKHRSSPLPQSVIYLYWYTQWGIESQAVNNIRQSCIIYARLGLYHTTYGKEAQSA